MLLRHFLGEPTHRPSGTLWDTRLCRLRPKALDIILPIEQTIVAPAMTALGTAGVLDLGSAIRIIWVVSRKIRKLAKQAKRGMIVSARLGWSR